MTYELWKLLTKKLWKLWQGHQELATYSVYAQSKDFRKGEWGEGGGLQVAQDFTCCMIGLVTNMFPVETELHSMCMQFWLLYHTETISMTLNFFEYSDTLTDYMQFSTENGPEIQ